MDWNARSGAPSLSALVDQRAVSFLPSDQRGFLTRALAHGAAILMPLLWAPQKALVIERVPLWALWDSCHWPSISQSHLSLCDSKGSLAYGQLALGVGSTCGMPSD